jgi:uncharacterized membrane protein YkvA (DUF1232 family)
LWTKVIPFLGVAYLIFPFDFIPDLIPGLGQVDDLSVLLMAMWAFLQLVPANVIRQMSNNPAPAAPNSPPKDPNVVDAAFRVVKDEGTTTSSPNNTPPTARP